MKILFICTYNRCRSITAEWLYGQNSEYQVKSAGTAFGAFVEINEELLLWADQIFVFEKAHRNSIREKYPQHYAKLKIECLYVEDIYEPMSPILIQVLAGSLRKYLGPPNRDFKEA